MTSTFVYAFCCHHPPPGLAFGEPDDRLQLMIRYCSALAIGPGSRNVLDTAFAGYDGQLWSDVVRYNTRVMRGLDPRIHPFTGVI